MIHDTIFIFRKDISDQVLYQVEAIIVKLFNMVTFDLFLSTLQILR